MRMWLVDPKLMCNRHLLGEHVEMHMFAGTIRKGKSIQGYLDRHLVETGKIALRHDELAAEMAHRGMNHKTPLAQPFCHPCGLVQEYLNLMELVRRCPECRERIIRTLGEQSDYIPTLGHQATSR